MWRSRPAEGVKASVCREFASKACRSPRSSATEGLWSRKFAGIYLPGGHWIQDRYREGEAFFVVSGDGTLASRRPIPSIAYRDEIEEMEARIGAKVLGDSFPGLRAALGISSGSY
jgi:hypothetical protein